ncbi:hypothetical protein BGZ65_003115 [Modicella reniformis]|uniref:Uncharacterized protein n=1 Tax=Modicella reniformis TaxID=1440133 RepID=A0A9P6M9E4_9FUNG|nr:hypothetical protein BGZ65_003115 [Modicella reniformis]
MSLFKSSKNKSASAATSPSATPRSSMQDQRPAPANKMTQEQALETLLRKTMADATFDGARGYVVTSSSRLSSPQKVIFTAALTSTKDHSHYINVIEHLGLRGNENENEQYLFHGNEDRMMGVTDVPFL